MVLLIVVVLTGGRPAWQWVLARGPPRPARQLHIVRTWRLRHAWGGVRMRLALPRCMSGLADHRAPPRKLGDARVQQSPISFGARGNFRRCAMSYAGSKKHRTLVHGGVVRTSP